MTTYTIRALVWEKDGGVEISRTKTIMGRYRAGMRGDGTWGWDTEYGGGGGFADIEVAKAAAEAHYRERILTALEVVG